MGVRVACYPRGSERGSDFFVTVDGPTINVVAVAPNGELEVRVLDLDERRAWRDAVKGETRNGRAYWVAVTSTESMFPPWKGPHAPASDDDDSVTCAGCGHPVSGMDDVMAWDAIDAPGGFLVAHVDCA